MTTRLTDDIEILLDRIIHAIEIGRLKTAEHLLGRALPAAPDDPRLVEASGLLMTLLDRPDEARAAYEKAIRLDPENVKNRFFLARLYQDAGRPDEAERLLAEAIHRCQTRLAANPDDLEAVQDLVRIHSHREEHDKALLATFRGLRRAPDALDLLQLAVQEEYNLSHYGQAVRDAEAALLRHPADATLLLYQGLSLQKLNLIRLALEAMRRSLDANPRQPELKRLIRKIGRAAERNGPTIEETLLASPEFPRVPGRVNWFRDETGIGAIALADGRELFVHYLAIEKEGYQLLREGERVTCVVIDSPQGPLAARIRSEGGPPLAGVVAWFDEEQGIGEVEYDSGRKAWLHFTSLIGVGARLPAVGLAVRFELVESEHGPQAFNVTPVAALMPPAADGDPDDRLVGTITWLDREKGLGLITAGALRAIFTLDDVRSGTPAVGAVARFVADAVEALQDENVKKAREIEIEPPR